MLPSPLPILFAVTLGVLTSCTHDPIDPVDPIDPPLAGACDPDTVYFQNDVLPVLVANCASSGCHSDNNPADGLALTSYAGVMDEVKAGDPYDSEVYTALLENGDDLMPPAPAAPLSATTIAMIKTWIDQGALNNSCNECDTSDITFSSNILSIVQGQCQSCHSTATPSGGVSLMSHAEVAAAVTNNNLMDAINRVNYSPMPPAMSLSECEINQFKIWVNDGMPNN